MHNRALVILMLVLSFDALGFAQQKPTTTKASASDANPTSGAQLYRTYCAVCHGPGGKGDGPAAAALKERPTDLTLLAKKAGGEFPSFRVSNVIQGDADITAHGSRQMPMWGDVFRGTHRDESIVKLRVHNLTQYLAELQQK